MSSDKEVFTMLESRSRDLVVNGYSLKNIKPEDAENSICRAVEENILTPGRGLDINAIFLRGIYLFNCH